MLNSLSCCLSVMLLICPSYLNDNLARYSNLVYKFFSFITLSMFWHSLLIWRVSTERSSIILMGIPLCVICWFSLALFNICSLCLTFVSLINVCVRVFCLGYLVWVSLGFLDLAGYFPLHYGDTFNYYFLKYFLMPFLSVFFFWDSYDLNIGTFNIFPEVSEIVLI